jgi:dipeptidyl aminopeptidase/acylaminoacyl peptidase
VRAALLAIVALLTAAAVAADAAPVVLHPVRALAAEPAPPVASRADDVLVRSGDDVLAGTLTRPLGPGPFPAVVLISGSGAQDRDDTVDGRRPFRVLADALTGAGFAVLRTDDRGVGGSAGSYAAATYDDLTSDVLAQVSYLATRPDVDPARIGLLGHSEGGYLAPLAVSRSQDMVAFVVLLAAPAVPGADLLAHRGRPVDRQGAGPRQRSFLDYDPGPALGALPVPVLAVYGDQDVQVPPEQSVPVLTTLLAGKPDVAVDVLPGLDHSLRPVGEYDDAHDTTIAPDALDLVTGWMKERFGG